MNQRKRLLKDGLLTAGILLAVFVLLIWMQEYFSITRIIPMLFVLGVFLVSLKTEGYFWGVLASVIAVILVNYAFMQPYYEIDLLSPVNLTTAVVMLAVSILTGMLTTKISEQQKEKANAEREKMRANLLRAISHDLRTPLTSIYGTCSLMEDEYDSVPKEKQKELLAGMKKDADWLIRMVENLLSVTRIDENKKMVTKTPTVLEELIDSLLVRFYNHYPNIEVNVDIPDAFVSIPMDAMLIEQVLMNMLENAVDHAEGMTELKLAVAVDKDTAHFCVCDNGCGIPKNRLNDLFSTQEPQAQRVSDGKRAGMGIGLFVCDAIVRAHGSSIRARNLPEGGAEFSFSLAMEETNEQ